MYMYSISIINVHVYTIHIHVQIHVTFDSIAILEISFILKNHELQIGLVHVLYMFFFSKMKLNVKM